MAADCPLVVSVAPSWRRSRCGTCGRRAARYDRQPIREWRHLSWGRVPALLRYAPWRVSCRRCCGVKVERVPWASGVSVFTSEFEELAAYLSQVTDRTSVSRLLGISWATVGNIVERVVARRLDGARFAQLRRIGVDEFSYRKRHHYLTVVVDHDDARRVVWAGKGRSAETLGAFFGQLGPGGCARIELVTADLASSWQKALATWVDVPFKGALAVPWIPFFLWYMSRDVYRAARATSGNRKPWWLVCVVAVCLWLASGIVYTASIYDSPVRLMRVVGSSMRPTFSDGDWVVLYRIGTSGDRMPAPGDAVAFENPLARQRAGVPEAMHSDWRAFLRDKRWSRVY